MSTPIENPFGPNADPVRPAVTTKTPTTTTADAATFANLVQAATDAALGRRQDMDAAHRRQIATETPERQRQAQQG
jgi:hypothetical protein